MFWVSLWKICLITSMIAFAVMAVIVTIGGAADVRKMIRSLGEKKD